MTVELFLARSLMFQVQIFYSRDQLGELMGETSVRLQPLRLARHHPS
jgi:hypothetical protein